MAYQKMGTPVDFMNRKQLVFRCRQLGLAVDLSKTNAQLITAIKAA